MPRAIWSGAISFGLVTIPVKLLPAVQRKQLSFRELRRGDGARIRHKRVAATDGREVPFEDIVKGYEIAPDQYVVLEPEELKALDPKATRTIDIEQFVDAAAIDPVYYDSSYYLVPDQVAAKAYTLLRQALADTGRVGIGRFVMRTRQYLVAIRPRGPALALSTMVYADEVVPVESLDGLPTDVELSERELEMARQLIETMTAPWEPERFRDEYRERVLELIRRKAEGEELVVAAAAEPEAGEVVDLVAALEASLAKARGERHGDGAASA